MLIIKLPERAKVGELNCAYAIVIAGFRLYKFSQYPSCSTCKAFLDLRYILVASEYLNSIKLQVVGIKVV
jgi:hypothetical protein